ncbi:MAG: hypothetical protein U0522_03165 [Candidatus Paceibacterota bacterium]
MIIDVGFDVPVGEFLELGFGGYGRATVGAFHHAHEIENVSLRTWTAFAAEKELDFVVVLLGDDRFVRAMIPFAASERVLVHSVIESVGEDAVDSASAKFLSFWCAEAPLIVRHIPDLERTIVAGEHQFHHFLYERKDDFIGYNFLVAFLGILIIQVAQRSGSREDAEFRLLF